MVPPDVWHSFPDLADRMHHSDEIDREHLLHDAFEKNLLSDPDSKSYEGQCAACEHSATFSYIVSTDGYVNWRESLVCDQCEQISRTRASIEVLRRLGVKESSRIYATEQVTKMFEFLKINFSNVTGSEFLGDEHDKGAEIEMHSGPVRHEDLTDLTFSKKSFDFVLCFDVLEHVPDYLAALGEIYRCMAPGGHLILSVPFCLNDQQTVVRARLTDSGEIEHLKPPQYHGDPMSDKGVLCFYEFGWQLLDELRDFGFKDVRAIKHWSVESGYLGNDNVMFVARKPKWTDVFSFRSRK